jgi:hypothetical protein
MPGVSEMLFATLYKHDIADQPRHNFVLAGDELNCGGW